MRDDVADCGRIEETMIDTSKDLFNIVRALSTEPGLGHRETLLSLVVEIPWESSPSDVAENDLLLASIDSESIR